MRFTLLAALLAVGCYTESDFIPAKTTAFCSLVLQCTDPATLAFDGLDATSCEARYGPIFRDEAQGCKIRKSAAKDCVAALEAGTCPADGSVEDNLPEICEAALTKCPITFEPEDTDVVPPGNDTGTGT
ncbi:MAG: hypothetical protein R3F61_03175 [Myxococcota bacterium]